MFLVVVHDILVIASLLPYLFVVLFVCLFVCLWYKLNYRSVFHTAGVILSEHRSKCFSDDILVTVLASNMLP